MTYRGRCDARRMRMQGAGEVELAKVPPPRSRIFTPDPKGSLYWILLRRRRTHRLAKSLGEWAQWFEHGNRTLFETTVGPYWVSSIFLGLDYSFGMGPPRLYETMVFRPCTVDGRRHLNAQGWMARASTWDEAEAQHAEAVAWAKAHVN